MTGARHRVWIDRAPPPGLEVPHDVELVATPQEAAGAVVGAAEPWGDDALGRLPMLEVVARSGIGYDNVDLAACTRQGVAACNAPDAPTVSTAEHALALMLAVAKTLPAAARRLREARGGYIDASTSIELRGLTLGLVGCGRIGARLGAYASALGMRVIAHDPHLSEAPVGRLVDRATLWRESQVLSLHAPATPETHHLVDADVLAALPRGAVVVNCARGALVDHDALLAALESGHLAGAGLDVTHPEPLPPDHPLLRRDDVVVTPHVASSTVAGRLRLVDHALTETVTWLRGGRPEHLLNPEVLASGLDRRRARQVRTGTAP